ATGTNIPGPGTASRGVESETEPLFAFHQCFLGAAALRDIQFETGEPYYLSVGIPLGLTETLDPRDPPIGPHHPECDVKGVLPLCVQDLVPDLEHVATVFFVHTAEPSFKRDWFSSGETVQLAEAIIPFAAISPEISHPGTSPAGVESETEPLFAFL